MSSRTTLTFLGAAGTVTGSRYLLAHGGRRLLVDCGLFQGLKQLRLRNWDRFPVDPHAIDAVVLTHAHIDHSGYLPALAKQGFRGPVHATEATCELAGILLPDSGHLQEEEAEFANRHGFSKHHPALPLYTEDDARRVLRQLRRTPFHSVFEPIPGVRVQFIPAGHILGAASVHVQWDGGSVLFSGDLGRDEDILMRPPETPPAADTVLIESTYGERAHLEEDPATTLAEVVSRTAARGGVVVIPAFAVGRAQALMHLVAQLKEQRRMPDVPVFLNSPMAANVTELYHRYRAQHRLDEAQCRAMCQAVRIVNTVEESQRLNEMRVPAVIIAASGMATGGRVVHHLKAFAPDRRNTILLAGYQAAGTRGAALAGGAPEVKIHGEYVKVRAEVVSLGSLSAHADRSELLNWLGKLPSAPRQVFVTHGEPVASDSLRLAIEDTHGFACSVPEQRQEVEL
ncbi:MBL fold metallo-hydrolase [Ramlibacter tataouinensis]|uniref:MBL fold metallo-hydrolase n=1 Tax=Ramlibacter tataouinensis TaxID=94132 RepID=UPI0022F3AD60|nr:MBL fold metallo-hydrolase [Ramlibacter tataouinensis]WBY01323.1 MBL fold metallo-hydrolase [Ramlibacter tataouinensis]